MRSDISNNQIQRQLVYYYGDTKCLGKQCKFKLLFLDLPPQKACRRTRAGYKYFHLDHSLMLIIIIWVIQCRLLKNYREELKHLKLWKVCSSVFMSTSPTKTKFERMVIWIRRFVEEGCCVLYVKNVRNQRQKCQKAAPTAHLEYMKQNCLFDSKNQLICLDNERNECKHGENCQLSHEPAVKNGERIRAIAMTKKRTRFECQISCREIMTKAGFGIYQKSIWKCTACGRKARVHH